MRSRIMMRCGVWALLLVGAAVCVDGERAYAAAPALADPIEPPKALHTLIDSAPLTAVARERRGLTLAEVLKQVESQPLPEPGAEQPAQPLSDEAAGLVRRSDEAVAAGRVYEGVKLLREAEKLEPDHRDVIRRLGVGYTLSGNRIRGAVYLQRSLLIDPSDPGVIALLCQQVSGGSALGQTLGYCAALSEFGQAKTLADYYRAQALERSGYTAAAAQCLSQVLADLPTIDLKALTEDGATDAVLLRELRVLKAMRDSLHLRLGDLYLQSGRGKQADAQYAQIALETATDPAAVAARRAYLALVAGDADAAVGHVVSLLSAKRAEEQDAKLAAYLIAQGVAPAALVGQLEQAMAQRGATLPLFAAMARAGDKSRVVAALADWLPQQSVKSESLRRVIGILGFSDDDPGDAEPLAQLLVFTAGQISAEPTQAERLSAAVLDELKAHVCLLRALKADRLIAPEDPALAYLCANAFARVGKDAKAIEHYRRALASQTGLSKQAGLPLARLLVAGEQYREAVDVLGKPDVMMGRDRFEVFLRAMAGAGKAGQAIARLDEWQKQHGEDHAARMLRLDLIAMKPAIGPREASAYLQRLIGANPRDERLYRAGFALIRKHARYANPNDPLLRFYGQLIQNLMRNLPDSVTAKMQLAMDIYDEPQRNEQAQTLLLSILEQEPDNTLAWSMLVTVYDLAKDGRSYESARASYLAAMPAGVDRELTRASWAVEQGDLDQAKQLLHTLFAIEQEGVLPGPALTGDQAAGLIQLLGAAAEDDAYEERALAMVVRFPDNAQLNNALGYRWAVQGKNLLQAQTMIERAIKQTPDSHSLQDSLAWVLYKLGKFEEAETVQRKAIDLLRVQQLRLDEKMPGSKAVLYDHMGDIMFKKGSVSSAVRYWQIARAQRLDDEEVMLDPELRTLPQRVEAKIDAIREGAQPPVAPVPGPEAHGPAGHPADLAAGQPVQEPAKPGARGE